MAGRSRRRSSAATPGWISPCSAPRSPVCPPPTSMTMASFASAIWSWRSARAPPPAPGSSARSTVPPARGARGLEPCAMLAVDLTLYPGFSGGPLVDVLGRIVGITTSGASRHLQCAVRASAVTRLTDHVVRGGRIPRAYLGVGTQPVVLPSDLRERLGLTQRTAVIVVNVGSDSPAAAAGLVIGDVVVSISGHAITEPGDLVAVLQPDRVGHT